jgi:hypothetical protein
LPDPEALTQADVVPWLEVAQLLRKGEVPITWGEAELGMDGTSSVDAGTNLGDVTMVDRLVVRVGETDVDLGQKELTLHGAQVQDPSTSGGQPDVLTVVPAEGEQGTGILRFQPDRPSATESAKSEDPTIAAADSDGAPSPSQTPQ